jgi:FkbM family methyltransferase
MSEIKNELEIIKSLYEKNPNLIVFDIGAHSFYDGVTYKNTFPTIDVYGFEADIKNINKYRHFAETNGVFVTNAALSDEDCEIMFYPSLEIYGQPHTDSGSIFKVIIGNPDMIWGDSYKVQSIRIDTFCDINNINNIDYIHMDVQGAEYKVISGLGKYRPTYIFAETDAFEVYDTGVTETQFNDLMSSLGYIIISKFEHDTLYKYISKYK